MLGNLDFVATPDTSLIRYRDHSRILLFFLTLNLMFEILLYTYLFWHRSYIIASLADTYRDVAVEKIERIFVGGTLLDVIVNIAMYFRGFKALTSH